MHHISTLSVPTHPSSVLQGNNTYTEQRVLYQQNYFKDFKGFYMESTTWVSVRNTHK